MTPSIRVSPVAPAAALAGALAVVVAVALVAAGRARLDAWRHERLTRDGRWVTVAAPPQVDPGSAATFWRTLAGVLTPGLRTRLLYGTAHIGWEYTWTGRRLQIRVWVPGTIPPGAVEAAVAAAWPGATWTTTPAEPPLPTHTSADGPGGERVGERVEAGGAWWPQHPDVVPLRTDHDHDPLRALIAAGASISARDHACVQVLARPATAARLAAARRTATAHGSTTSGGAALTGGLARLLVEALIWVLEVFLPGRPTRAHRHFHRSRKSAQSKPLYHSI